MVEHAGARDLALKAQTAYAMGRYVLANAYQGWVLDVLVRRFNEVCEEHESRLAIKQGRRFPLIKP